MTEYSQSYLPLFLSLMSLMSIMGAAILNQGPVSQDTALPRPDKLRHLSVIVSWMCDDHHNLDHGSKLSIYPPTTDSSITFINKFAKSMLFLLKNYPPESGADLIGLNHGCDD